VILIFHETKIPIVDMKVLVYSKFNKNKICKKMKSPSSMKNGRFHPPKCRGKLQKMRVLYTHSPKILGPSSCNKKKVKKIQKLQKKGGLPTVYETVATTGKQPLVAGRPWAPNF
jgi:hypothetical protein